MIRSPVDGIILQSSVGLRVFRQACRACSRPTLLQAAFVTGVLAFGVLSFLAARYHTFPGDMAVVRFTQAHRTDMLDHLAVAASYTGYHAPAALMVISMVGILWFYGQRRDAITIALAGISMGLVFIMKDLVDRPRPNVEDLTSPGHLGAFPSGHADFGLAFFVLLGYLLGQQINSPRLRWAVWGLLGLVILAVGASRVYLGAHWPSDVIGGYLLGALSVGVILYIRKKGFFLNLK